MTSIYKRTGRPGWTVAWLEGGKKRQRTRRTREAAQAYAAQLTLDGSGLLAHDVLFKDYAPKVLELREADLAFSTIETRRYLLRVHLVPAFGALKLRAITRRQVVELVASKRREGFSAPYVASLRQLLRSILDEAIQDQILRNNVAAGPGLKAPRVTQAERKARIKAMTLDQIRAFLAVLPRDPEWSVALRLGLSTGVRPGELLALRWDDVDFVSSQLAVRRGRFRVAGGWSDDGPTKTRRERLVDVPPDMLARLRSAHAAAKAAALASGGEVPRYLFPSESCGMRSRLALARALQRALAWAKLPSTFTPHCLRHTYATQQLLGGAAIQYVRDQLGHSSISITVDTYGSWLPAGSRAAAEAFERRIHGASGDKAVTGTR